MFWDVFSSYLNFFHSCSSIIRKMMIKRPTMIANDVDSHIHNSKENYSCVKFHRTHLQNQNKKQNKKKFLFISDIKLTRQQR